MVSDQSIARDAQREIDKQELAIEMARAEQVIAALHQVAAFSGNQISAFDADEKPHLNGKPTKKHFAAANKGKARPVIPQIDSAEDFAKYFKIPEGHEVDVNFPPPTPPPRALHLERTFTFTQLIPPAPVVDFKVRAIHNASKSVQQHAHLLAQFNKAKLKSPEIVPLQTAEELPPPFVNVYTAAQLNHAQSKLEYSESERRYLASYRMAASLGGPVLLVKDDIYLPSNLLVLVSAAVHLAPTGWDVLQLHVEPGADGQLDMIQEPFIKWTPDHRGSSMVLLSKEAAHKIATKSIELEASVEYLLYFGMRAYTFTWCWFESNSNFAGQPATRHTPPNSGPMMLDVSPNSCSPRDANKQPTPTTDRVLAATIATRSNFVAAQTLQTKLKLSSGFDGIILADESNSTRHSTFANFLRIANVAFEDHDLANYDWILLYDSDLECAALPAWVTVLTAAEKQDEIIALTRESPTQDGGRVQSDSHSTFDRRDAVLIHNKSYVNPAAVLIRVEFFKWFVQQLSEVVHQVTHLSSLGESVNGNPIGGGIDQLWCGAAKDYHTTSAQQPNTDSLEVSDAIAGTPAPAPVVAEGKQDRESSEAAKSVAKLLKLLGGDAPSSVALGRAAKDARTKVAAALALEDASQAALAAKVVAAGVAADAFKHTTMAPCAVFTLPTWQADPTAAEGKPLIIHNMLADAWERTSIIAANLKPKDNRLDQWTRYSEHTRDIGLPTMNVAEEEAV
jgi:hypothetical protein